MQFSVVFAVCKYAYIATVLISLDYSLCCLCDHCLQLYFYTSIESLMCHYSDCFVNNVVSEDTHLLWNVGLVHLHSINPQTTSSKDVFCNQKPQFQSHSLYM